MPGGAELAEKLPDELFQLVESFKKFIREQKSYRDQKFELDAILEIRRDAEMFTVAFQRVAVDSDKNSQLVQQIKDDTSKLLRHAELAYSLLRSHFSNNPSSTINHQQPNQQQQQPQNQQQTGMAQFKNNSLNFSQHHQQSSSSFLQQQHFPFVLSTGSPNYNSNHHNQFSNTSSSQYFEELADSFELRMKAYGEQIKELKLSLDSLTKTYNVEELSAWLKKQHETLGEIAAKIYITHERIMEKKSKMG